MDYLATFINTQAVLQAEQILIRRKIPFETVPHSQFERSGCGLAILFSEKHLSALRQALKEIHIQGKFFQIDETPPHKSPIKR